jgi:N utilization substance protein A
MKGMRVQSIIRELRGEKIDIIEYSEDSVSFATHALSPAKVSRITVIDPAEKHMEVIVDDSQLSLAIGKKGQNVRLAAKLLGWKIDIKSEEEKRQEVESQMAALVAPGAPISVLAEYGLDEIILEKLLETGVGTIERLGSMTPEQLEEIQGIGQQTVEKIQESVNAYYSQFEDPVQESGDRAEVEIADEIADEVAGESGAAGIEETAETPQSGEAVQETVAEDASEPAAEDGAVEAETAAAPPEETAEQFGTIEDAGFPHNQSGAGPEEGSGQ